MGRRRAGAVSALATLLLGVPMGPASGFEDRCPAASPTVVGTEGDDVLVGTDGDDVLVGLGGDDVLRGLDGNDVLCGGEGTDRLVGGSGDDDLHGGANGLQPSQDSPPTNVGDVLVPGAGDDQVDPGHDTETDAGGGFRADRISFAGSVEAVEVDLMTGTVTGEGTDTLVLEGRVEVVGSAYDDVLSGSAGPDDLIGGDGSDVLRGFQGDDSLAADPTVYRLDSPGGDDQVHGGPGGDSIDLGNGDDVARGGPGRDAIVHGSGSVDLRGGPGRDYLDLWLLHADGQQILGGSGRDTLYAWSVVDADHDIVEAHGRIDLPDERVRIVVDGVARRSVLGGFEVLRVPNGTWRVTGTRQDEVFYGGETGWSRLIVRAAGGDDLIGGSPGDDWIHGGPGRDRSGDDQGRDVCISIERWFGGQRCEITR